MTEYYKKIEGDLFDFENYYLKMAGYLPNNCRIAEIGVANGKSAMFLAEALLGAGKRIDRFVLVDNLDYGGADQATAIVNHLIQSGIGYVFDFLQMDSLNASLKFPDNYFHLAFIDSGHTLELTKAEIRLWNRKIMDTWFLSGHDTHLPEVMEAVNEVIPVNNISFIDTDKGWGVWQYRKDPSIIF